LLAFYTIPYNSLQAMISDVARSHRNFRSREDHPYLPALATCHEKVHRNLLGLSRHHD
jgi:hypothetical protein